MLLMLSLRPMTRSVVVRTGGKLVDMDIFTGDFCVRSANLADSSPSMFCLLNLDFLLLEFLRLEFLGDDFPTGLRSD